MSHVWFENGWIEFPSGPTDRDWYWMLHANQLEGIGMPLGPMPPDENPFPYINLFGQSR